MLRYAILVLRCATNAMLRYAMLRYAMLRYAMLRYAIYDTTRHDTTRCDAIRYFILCGLLGFHLLME
jgi:hypothetical protein